MATIVDCQSCGGKLRVPDELLGRKVKCPKCSTVFAAGQSTAPDATPPPPASEDGSGGLLGPPLSLDGPAALPSGASPPAEQAAPPPPDEPALDERPWESPRPAVRRDIEPHRATLIFVLGLLSAVFGAFVYLWWVGPILGIFPIVMGTRDLRKMRRGEMDPQGEGMTRAGWICGIVGTALGATCTVGIEGLILIQLLFLMRL